LNILDNVLKALIKHKDKKIKDIQELDCWQIEVECFRGSEKSLSWIGGDIGELCMIDSTWSESTIDKKVMASVIE